MLHHLDGFVKISIHWVFNLKFLNFELYDTLYIRDGHFLLSRAVFNFFELFGPHFQTNNNLKLHFSIVNTKIVLKIYTGGRTKGFSGPDLAHPCFTSYILFTEANGLPKGYALEWV